MSDPTFLRFKFSNVFVPVETVILGFYGVVFWPEPAKMSSILFEILSSDDMQEDYEQL